MWRFHFTGTITKTVLFENSQDTWHFMLKSPEGNLREFTLSEWF
jgi:hypothetical protein